MTRDKQRPGLWRPASYRIEVAGHLNVRKATWFEGFALTNDYHDDGTPVTVIAGEVADQAMLHGLLHRVRDLGLPLLNVSRIEPDEGDAGCPLRH